MCIYIDVFAWSMQIPCGETVYRLNGICKYLCSVYGILWFQMKSSFQMKKLKLKKTKQKKILELLIYLTLNVKMLTRTFFLNIPNMVCKQQEMKSCLNFLKILSEG